MPPGIVKTPTAAPAKDAKDASKSNGSSAKKFVQTRLLFKLLTPGEKPEEKPATATTSAKSGSVKEPKAATGAARKPHKRKLYAESEPETEPEPDSKESREVGKKSKMDEIIVLVDNDDEAEEQKEAASKADVEVQKSGVIATLPPPIQIKLPLSSKRSKRRKSLKKSEPLVKEPAVVERSDSSDDIECLNPQKRPKVIELKAKPESKPAQVEPKIETEKSKTVTRATKGKVDSKPETKVESKSETQATDKQVESKPQTRIKPAKEESKTEAIAKQVDKVQANGKSKTDLKSMTVEMATEHVESDADEILLDSDEEAANGAEQSISSNDVDMDVDTDTLNKTSPEKEEQQTEKEKEAGAASASGVVLAGVVEKPANLTPKQQKVLEQRRKAREEKERMLQDERRLKQQEKEQREQQKKAEREQKEADRRKERDQKEEERRKEREERERKRQAEVDSKNEERRKRNEAKEEVQRKKDEERRRKELEKEEAELKKKRAAESFTKFFVPKQPKLSVTGTLEHDQNSSDSGPIQSSSGQQLAFRPFQVKDDMVLAPTIRATIANDTRRQLDALFHVDTDDDEEDLNESIGRVKRPNRAQLYLNELSLGRHKPQRSLRASRLQRRTKDDDEDDDVQVVGDIVEEKPKQLPWTRAKYLHFGDNRRPPYYGTWRKRSQLIHARRPTAQDKAHFDYEVDSDCEWEEEEPGESLSASEDEKERESEEESEEEYNEWFVPHGHLSDEELQNDGDLENDNTREAQKAKLQVLQQEFAQEMRKQTKKIKPRLLGPVWLDDDGNKSQLCPAVFIQTIDMYECWQLQPLTLEPPAEPEQEEEPPEEVKPKSTMQLDEPLLQQLLRLIHGNSNSKAFLISEYLEYLKTKITPESQTLLPAKTLLREKFDELAAWKPVELNTGVEAKKSKKPKKRLCWVVNPEALQKYQLDELTLQNQWNYVLTPKTSKADTSLRESSPPADTPDADGGDTPISETSKRTNKREDSISSCTSPTQSTGSPSTTPAASKKRGTLLMSVQRDQQFHVPTKNALISQYLRKQNDDQVIRRKKKPSPPAPNSSDEIVLLSD